MKTWLRTEDGLAVLLGLTLVALGVASVTGVDLLGWVVNTNVWVDVTKAMTPISPACADLPGIVSLLLTYLFLLTLLLLGAYFLELNLPRFALGFTALFAL